MQALKDHLLNEMTIKETCKKHKISDHTFIQFRKSAEGIVMKDKLLKKKKELDEKLMNSILEVIDQRNEIKEA